MRRSLAGIGGLLVLLGTVLLGTVLLGIVLLGTVLVFRAFDRGSHSASDTLRPFLLTMAPVWIAWFAAARVLATHRRSPA